jgi:hypothetical protein
MMMNGIIPNIYWEFTKYQSWFQHFIHIITFNIHCNYKRKYHQFSSEETETQNISILTKIIPELGAELGFEPKKSCPEPDC